MSNPVIQIIASLLASIIFMVLFASNDASARLVRLLTNNPEPLEKPHRVAIRLTFFLLLSVAVGGFSWYTLWLAGANVFIGHIVFDPVLNKFKGRDIWYLTPNRKSSKYDWLWNQISGYDRPGLWSTIAETVGFIIYGGLWYLSGT